MSEGVSRVDLRLPQPYDGRQMDVLAPLGITAVAALFGYFATLIAKRHEATRQVSLDIDNHLQTALSRAQLDTVDVQPGEMDKVGSELASAEARALALPRSARSAVLDQILVAQSVAHHVYGREFDLAPWMLQRAVQAARDVLRPYLLPPPVLRRRPGRPRSFVDRATFAELLATSVTVEDALNAALDASDEAMNETAPDLFPIGNPPPEMQLPDSFRRNWHELLRAEDERSKRRRGED